MNLTANMNRGVINGVEVRGEVLAGYLDGLGNYSLAARSYLAQNGVHNIKGGGWYPLAALLSALQEIIDQGAGNMLKTIGEKTVADAVWPDGITSFIEAVSSVDTAYHMNHRRDGLVLFDEQTGKIIEGGIGHNKFFPDPEDDKKGYYVCSSFYPCYYDYGIVQSLVQKFKPAGASWVKVTHDDSGVCRSRGGKYCTYVITWN